MTQASSQRASARKAVGPRASVRDQDERARVEELLDAALMQTFPASDPVTLKACGADEPGDPRGKADPVPRGSGVHDGHAAARPRAPRRRR